MSAIPLKKDNPKGLHRRYIVTKPDEATDPMATYFVLRLDGFGRDGQHVAACRAAAMAYASYIENHAEDCQHLQTVGHELKTLVTNLERQNA